MVCRAGHQSNCTLRPFPNLATTCMPQQKILEDEFPLARPQRTIASTACYLTIIGFWASLNLDDVVERAAMPTFKKRLTRGRNVRRFAPHSHGTPPRCCNEHRRYVFGGPRAIRLRPGPVARAISVPRAVLVERHARDRRELWRFVDAAAWIAFAGHPGATLARIKALLDELAS
jgi:hypothetical protein